MTPQNLYIWVFNVLQKKIRKHIMDTYRKINRFEIFVSVKLISDLIL